MATFYQRPNINNTENNAEFTDGNLPNGKVKIPANHLAKWAQITGIMAIVSTLTFTIYLPFIFAALSLILAFLSRGKEDIHPIAKNGITLSLASVGCNIAIIVLTMTVMFGNGEIHNQFNKVFEQMYGQSFDEMMHDIQTGEFDQDEFMKEYMKMFE